MVYLAVIAYRDEDYDLLRSVVTVEAVTGVFGPILTGSVTRYELPRIAALNFALAGALGGGRTRNLAFDESGKALSSLVLGMSVVVPNGYVPRSREVAETREVAEAAGR